jgi:acetate---CoA ligase (ADP-forming)
MTQTAPVSDKSELTSLIPLFAPKSVAIIGASTNPDKVGFQILRNLVDSGYEGVIIPVNPSAQSILNLKCYKSLADYGNPIEQTLIVIPRPFVKDAVRESIAHGVKAITIITAGFKEQDAEGAALEREIALLCREADVALLGPNCLGHLNTHDKVNLSFGNKFPARGDISFISQSGALCSAILDRAVERGFGLGKMLSIGNKAGVSERELVAALADDDKTKVIVCYLEGIPAGRDFVKVAEAASGKKPIIVFKSGVTASGSRAASSHTGSLAGADVAYQTAFDKCGIIRAQTYEQMFEYAIAFEKQPLPPGNRVAIITNAGGPGIMTADAVELTGMTIAAISPATAEALRKVLPQAASVKNPVDVLGDADPSRYGKALELVAADPGVDAIIVLLTPQSVTKPFEIAQILCDNLPKGKPVLACFLGGVDVNPARAYMVTHGLPDFRSPEKAVNSLKAMLDYTTWRKRPIDEFKPFQADRTAVEAVIARYRAEKAVQINEADAKAILRAYGVQTAPGALVTNAEEAVVAAEQLGVPLAMKIVSPDIIHKSDVGGVVLNLKSADAVGAAYNDMMAKIKTSHPQARITGAYLERMAAPGSKEVIIGIMRDPQFGPLVMFGMGGIFVELLKDVRFALSPVSENDALTLLRQIKTYPLLAGYRGKPGVDTALLARTISRVSQLAADFPEIKELDINPFMAQLDPVASVAADARMTLSVE